MHWAGYIIPVLLSAFTGWVVAYAAVKLLFHPRQRVRILGMGVQGVFPKNQEKIAEKVSQAIAATFSFNDLEQKVTNPENFARLKPEIEEHIDHFLRTSLAKQFPMLSMFVGDKTINQLKAAFLTELESLFPVLMKSYMAKLSQDIDPEKTVKDKINGISSERLEELLKQFTGKAFLTFQFAGALLGFLMGLLQVLLNDWLS